MTEPKVFTPEELVSFESEHPEVAQIVNNIRIEERYLANKIMGDAGVPAVNRPKIYTDAADIITNIILAPKKQ